MSNELLKRKAYDITKEATYKLEDAKTQIYLAVNGNVILKLSANNSN